MNAPRLARAMLRALLLVPLAGGAAWLARSGVLGTRKPAAPAAPSPSPAPAPSSSHPLDGSLRVGLTRLSGQGSQTVKFPAGGTVRDGATNRQLSPVHAGETVTLVADYVAGQARFQSARKSAGAGELVLAGPVVLIGGHRYPNSIHVRLAGTGLELVNELDIEQYLEGVLPGELPPYFGIEAQKALAVAARTYALVQAGKHGTFDLCDRTHCQMYLGLRRAQGRALAAVRATRHLCLWSGDELAYTFYEADCGGLSTRVEEVPLTDKPDRPLPYLRAVRDAPPGGPDYCAKSPYHRWVKRFTLAELEERLNSEPETQVTGLTGVKFLDYDPTGRVRQVLLRYTEPAAPFDASSLLPSPGAAAGKPVEKRVSGWEFRRAVGPVRLKSLMMTLDEPQPGVYRFTGSGFGHGLGLCQIGADGMARRGFKFPQILEHYYPGTRVRALKP